MEDGEDRDGGGYTDTDNDSTNSGGKQRLAIGSETDDDGDQGPPRRGDTAVWRAKTQLSV